MLFWITENGSDERVLSEQPLHDGREQRTDSGVSVSWIGESLRAVRFDDSPRRGKRNRDAVVAGTAANER